MTHANDIRLRRLTAADAPALAVLANNKKVWDNLRDIMPYPYSLADAHFFVNLTAQEEPPVSFAITCKGDFCGMIGLVPQKDVYRKTAEIGYWLGELFWGRGIATAAVQLITEYGFNELGFIRIYTGVFAYNTGSMRVLEKNGYTKEAVFRQSILKNEQVWDEHRYAKLKPLT